MSHRPTIGNILLNQIYLDMQYGKDNLASATMQQLMLNICWNIKTVII